MTFKVTYRDKTGALRAECIEAASRPACMAECRRRGIVPVGVKESPSRLGRTKSSLSAGSRQWHISARAASVLALVLALAVGAWFWFGSNEASVNTAVNGKDASHLGGEGWTRAPDAPKRRIVDVPPRQGGDSAADQGRPTQPKSTVHDYDQACPPLMEGSPSNIVDNADTPTNTPPKPLFKTGAEQLLALATPSVPGAMVPPLPYVTEESLKEDIEKAMRTVIKPEKEDTEETLERKLTIAAQKEEFRKLREQGMTFTQYLEAMREKNNDDAQLLSDAHKLDEELYHDETVSDEDYKKQRKRINEALRERGLPEMKEERE